MTTFTKVPNEILDSMADLKPAAFKLAMALCRLTFGYHRDRVEISQNKLSEFTGLSRRGILNVMGEIEHLFTCSVEDKTTTWVVNSVHKGCKLSSQGLYTEFTSTCKLSLQDTSGLKKEKENLKKEKESTPPHLSAFEISVNGSPLTEPLKKITRGGKAKILTAAGELEPLGATPEQIESFPAFWKMKFPTFDQPWPVQVVEFWDDYTEWARTNKPAGKAEPDGGLFFERFNLDKQTGTA